MMILIQNGRNEVYTDNVLVYKYTNCDIDREVYFTNLVSDKLNTWEIITTETDIVSPSGKTFKNLLVTKYIVGVSFIECIQLMQSSSKTTEEKFIIQKDLFTQLLQILITLDEMNIAFNDDIGDNTIVTSDNVIYLIDYGQTFEYEKDNMMFPPHKQYVAMSSRRRDTLGYKTFNTFQAYDKYNFCFGLPQHSKEHKETYKKINSLECKDILAFLREIDFVFTDWKPLT